VNSTIACALVAVKKQVPVVHVEAGLRSGDRSMPEEINRVLTDQLSDLLFTTEASAADNLAREGIAPDRVIFAGNVMIDTLRYNLRDAVPAQETLHNLTGEGDLQRYGLLTLHRPSNVDDASTLRRLLTTLVEVSRETPLVFPLHPRTRARIDAAGLWPLLEGGRVILAPPQGYREMLGLLRDAEFVLTDSGGIQEETTALGVPCITLRESTERPITVEEGTNTIVGTDPAKLRAALAAIRRGEGKAARQPALWDGRAAERIAAAIVERYRPARAA
jgi:UDP-N-acetylglucosamine 2-epimerase (non-hydrolysing)